MRVPFLSILLFIIGVCISANGNADVVSDNRLYIEDIVLESGETKEVPLLLSNANVVKAVQGNIKLPDGFTFATKSNGRLDVKNVDERSEDFTLSCALQEDGSMTFAHYSGDGFAYDGNEGGIFTFKITADENVQPGNYSIVLSDVVLSINGVGYEMPDRVSKITIEGETPTIVTATALSYQRQYGAANPSFEYTTEGGELTGSPVITCEATATSPVGTYPIVIAQGTVTNENVSFVNGTLTITKVPLTITANNYTIEQGDALPSFEMTYDGFVNGETQDVLTTPPTITCTATDSNTPGTFDIVVSGAEAQNYNITYGKGTLTIRNLTDEEWLAKIKADLEVYRSYATNPLNLSEEIRRWINRYDKKRLADWESHLLHDAYHTASYNSILEQYNILLSEYETNGALGNERIEYNKLFYEGIFPEMKRLHETGGEWLRTITLICNDGGYIDVDTYDHFKLTNGSINYYWIDWSKSSEYNHVVVYRNSNSRFNSSGLIKIIPNEGYIIKSAKQNGEPIEDINHILFSEKEEVIEVEFVPDPVGIQSMKGEGSNTAIYNLSGQRLSQPQRGVNIVNGKKVVVK